MINQRDIKTTKNLISFIENNPSCYHVISSITSELAENGYERLEESSTWHLKPGGKYFVTRNLSSLLAFDIPDNPFYGVLICASHSDSPSFKLKNNAEMDVEDIYVKLNVEKYGGMIMSTWLDRPLSIAGKILVDTKNGIETRLVNIDRDFCIIPSLAIHMNRYVNDGYKFNPQKDMLPLIGSNAVKGRLMEIVADAAGVDIDKIIGSDLFLYNTERGVILGAENELFSISRIDDQQCAYCAKEAFITSENDRMMKMLAVFDNEEVGSGTKQGALSTFLPDTLERIRESLGISSSEMLQKLSSSMMLSCDNGHALHPNHTDKADPIIHPVMNGGIVIKYNANQKYTTDGVSCALLKHMFNKANVKYQEFFNRSDIAGGSTLGNLSNEKVSLNTVDIGAAQLAMHSCFETGGVEDTEWLIKGITAFYTSVIECTVDGKYLL